MKYLLALYRPDGYDAAVSENAAMADEIDSLNEEMKSAGVRNFAGGLYPPVRSNYLRPKLGGKVDLTNEPYLQSREFMSGFWILEVADQTEALAWAEKAALVCRGPVEVRPFY